MNAWLFNLDTLLGYLIRYPDTRIGYSDSLIDCLALILRFDPLLLGLAQR